MSYMVVGYDGSDCSLAALRWSLVEASEHGRSVRVISVLEPRLVPSMWTASVVAPPAEADLARVRAEVEDVVAKTAADLGTTQPVEVSVRVGHAGPTLIEAASDADGLVVGSHGHGTIERLLLGSVSTFVATHARCPVVVIQSAR